MKKHFILLSFFLSFILIGCSTSVKHVQNSSYTSQSGFSNKQRESIKALAISMLNTKYNYGGKRPDFGIDCSGFVTYIFKNAAGYNLTGAARHMAQKGKTINKKDAFNKKLLIGDLLFFNTTGKSYSHVGIYIGNDKFIHASSGQKKVVVSSIHKNYYKKRLELVKRY